MVLTKDINFNQNESFCAFDQAGDAYIPSSNHPGSHKTVDQKNELSEMQVYTNDSNSVKGVQQLEKLDSGLNLEVDGLAGKVFLNAQNLKQLPSVDHLLNQVSQGQQLKNPTRARSASLPINLYKCNQKNSFAGFSSNLTELGLSNASQKTLVPRYGYQYSPKQLMSTLESERKSDFININQQSHRERPSNDQPITRLYVRTSATDINALNLIAAHAHNETSNDLLKAESNFDGMNTNLAISGCKKPKKDGINQCLDRTGHSWQYKIRALFSRGCSTKNFRGRTNKYGNKGSTLQHGSTVSAGQRASETGSSSNKMGLACMTERHINENDNRDNMILIQKKGLTSKDRSLSTVLDREKKNTRLEPETIIDSQDSWGYSLEGMDAAVASIARNHIPEQATAEIGSVQPVSAFDTDDSSTLREKSFFAQLKEKFSKQINSRRDNPYGIIHNFDNDGTDNSQEGKRYIARVWKRFYRLSKAVR